MSEETDIVAVDTDPLLRALTDALRAGPGSPEWRDAVERARAGGSIQGDEHALLLATREHLAAGRDFRSVRAGPGFTRRVMARIDADAGSNQRRTFLSASMVAYVGAGLAIGAIMLLVSALFRAGAGQGTDGLAGARFDTTVSSASLSGALPTGWRMIGPLPIDPAKGLVPTAPGPANAYAGGGIVSTVPIPAEEPFAVEATFQFNHVGDAVVPQLFVTDATDFSADRAVTSHELTWFVREGHAQVATADARLADPKLAVVDGQTVVVRWVVAGDMAQVSCDGKTLWSGASGLSGKPRFVGVRVLCRGDVRRGNAVVVHGLKVLEK